jgi:hypothetical protein
MVTSDVPFQRARAALSAFDTLNFAPLLQAQRQFFRIAREAGAVYPMSRRARSAGRNRYGQKTRCACLPGLPCLAAELAEAAAGARFGGLRGSVFRGRN